MVDLLVVLSVFFGISNFYFFLFFRRNNKNIKLKIALSVVFFLTILLDIILSIKKSESFANLALENVTFLVLISILIPVYFLMLWGINSLLENIPIIRGYFVYNVVFSVLTISSTMSYYFFCLMVFRFNYFSLF